MIVVLVAPHTKRTGDVYDQLLDAIGIDASADEREKPSCCDEEGAPPSDEDVAEAIADAVEKAAGRARRRR